MQHLIGVAVIFVVACLGGYLLANGHAATPYATQVAASGTLAGGTSLQSSSSASDGKYVQFGNPLTPPPIPTSSVYLGAWVNPTGQSGGVLDKLPTLQTAIGRKLAILHIYTGWTDPLPTSTITAFVNNGSIPLIDWKGGGAGPGSLDCATANTSLTLADIAGGCTDSIINKYAESLKTFDHPVFLRWDWEMNLDDNPAHTDPADFVAAWQHIHKLFEADGATNVAFVWCPGLGSQSSSLTDFYPGNQYVDWIAIDGYDRQQLGSAAFANDFATWYSTWNTYGKPLMIGETGALNALNDGTDNTAEQAAYLQGMQADLKSGSYNDLKAVVYFDAQGPNGNWSLEGAGLSAFSVLANDSYFTFGE